MEPVDLRKPGTVFCIMLMKMSNFKNKSKNYKKKNIIKNSRNVV